MRIRLALVALVLLSAVPASAGPSVPLDFQGGTGFIQSTQTLEKYNVWPQPTDPAQLVIDPTVGCTWDINEHSDLRDSGDLAPGATASVDTCIIWDYNPMFVARNGNLHWWSTESHSYGFSILGPAGLNVQVCYSTPVRCLPAVVTQVDSKVYKYTLCSQMVYTPDDPALELIAGSTPDPLPWGSAPGEGVPSTVTLSVSNPTGRTARGIQANWGVSSDAFHHAGCSEGAHPEREQDYPFAWYSLP